MNDDRLEDQSRSPITTALRQEPESWTPDCLSPEQIVALAERSLPEAEAARLFAHAALCARCRREHAETTELLQLSKEVRTLEQPAEAASSTPAPASLPAPVTPLSLWPDWLRPALGFGFGAAAAGVLVYFALTVPAQRQRNQLASALAEQRAAQVRTEQELAELQRQNEGKSSRLFKEIDRLTHRLKVRERYLARIDQDAVALQQLSLPSPAWLASRGAGVVRGGGPGGNPAPEIVLVQPVDTAVWSRTPTLEARPVAGAARYQLGLEPEDSTEEIPPPKPLAPGRWQVTKPLQSGKVYQWAVTAQKGGQTLRSRFVRFYLPTEAERARVEKARKSYAANPLALAAVYAGLGLKAETEQQLRKLLEANPEHPVARRWLNELLRDRGEQLPPAPKPGA